MRKRRRSGEGRRYESDVDTPSDPQLTTLAWIFGGALVACTAATIALVRSGRSVPLLGASGGPRSSSRHRTARGASRDRVVRAPGEASEPRRDPRASR